MFSQDLRNLDFTIIQEFVCGQRTHAPIFSAFFGIIDVLVAQVRFQMYVVFVGAASKLNSLAFIVLSLSMIPRIDEANS
jgi:hypothetical protein